MAIIYGQNTADFLFGNPEADFIYGWDINNLPGNEGPADDNDQISAGDGADEVRAGNGNDQVWGEAGADTLFGGAGNDDLVGGLGVDTINGGDDNDRMWGEDDGDTLNGGNGLDDLVGGSGNDTLNGEAGNDRLWGDTDTDILNGGAGNDELNGGAGNDTVDGGADDDTIFNVDGNGFDTINGGTGIDWAVIDRTSTALGLTISIANTAVLQTLADTTSVINIEHLGFVAGSGADNLTGGALTDDLRGNGGADILNGGSGDDVVLGGSEGDTVNGDGGNDDVRGDAGVDIVDGGAGIDQVYGGTGDDTLNGGAENDFMFVSADEGNDDIDGGNGSDYLYFDRTGSTLGLTVSLAAPAILVTLADTTTIVNIERFWFRGGEGIDVVTGGAIEDVLDGNGGSDTLNGGAGADVLDGGLGNDAMTGGLGNDIFYVDNMLDTVNETAVAGAGSDFIYTSVNYTLAAYTERLFLTGVDNINGIGRNGFVDVLTGNSGHNILNGLTGNDVARGGLGHDTYFVDSTTDLVEEATNAGTDSIKSTATFTMTINTERLYLIGTAAIDGTGLNAKNDLIVGNGAANKINGLTGNDTLIGGLGPDTFIFNTTPSAATNHDTITDFNVADDTISLENAIFSLLAATGMLVANLFEDTSIAGQNGSEVIVYDRANGDLYYDANGAATAVGLVLFADVTNNTALTAADFVVV